jgi:hypothetical protein
LYVCFYLGIFNIFISQLPIPFETYSATLTSCVMSVCPINFLNFLWDYDSLSIFFSFFLSLWYSYLFLVGPFKNMRTSIGIFVTFLTIHFCTDEQTCNVGIKDPQHYFKSNSCGLHIHLKSLSGLTFPCLPRSLFSHLTV